MMVFCFDFSKFEYVHLCLEIQERCHCKRHKRHNYTQFQWEQKIDDEILFLFPNHSYFKFKIRASLTMQGLCLHLVFHLFHLAEQASESSSVLFSTMFSFTGSCLTAIFRRLCVCLRRVPFQPEVWVLLPAGVHPFLAGSGVILGQLLDWHWGSASPHISWPSHRANHDHSGFGHLRQAS